MGKIRRTKSVRFILDVFDRPNIALSIAELLNICESQMNKTTVYRILERLESEGICHSFAGVNGQKWYALSRSGDMKALPVHHSHFQCKACGATKCLLLEIDMPTLPNHQIEEANLVLVGKCADCQE